MPHQTREKTKVTEDLLPAYDYIIVGAGSAGCVLANRLSEDADRTVLLLEAGDDDTQYPDIQIPAKCGSLLQGAFLWGLQTVPQKHAGEGIINRTIPWPRGKVIGGTGSINYLNYMRGTPHDFDLWQNMGCDGWSYEDVLPYFIKSEDCKIPELLEEGVHGSGGPLSVTQAEFSNLGQIFVEAGKALGYRETDNNGRDPIGFMKAQTNTEDGARAHTAEAFLRPAMHRENLHISSNSHVTKLLIDNNVARAVEFVRYGQKATVRAKREIVLSAGTIGSPQILMLSGIGPGGPMSTTLVEGVALIRTSRQSVGDPNPDIEIAQVSGPVSPAWKTDAAIKQEVWDSIIDSTIGRYTVSFFPILCHPKSIGTVRLRSSEPMDKPLIDPNYLSDPEDTKTLAEGLKITLGFANTTAFKSIGARLTGKVLAGYDGVPYTDEYWEKYVKTLASSGYHPVGTCRMGRADDPTTVVDPQLRIKGIRNLRVADASIMPAITSANVNAPTIMIAEMAADMIRGRQPGKV